MLADALKSCGAGVVFGAALTVSGVAQPQVIIEQMRLHDFHMLEVFLVAGASSAYVFRWTRPRTMIITALSFVVFALDRLSIRTRTVRTNASLNLFSRYDGNILGGLLLGLGMSLSSACPGTVLVQLAQGFPPSKFTALGAVLGASMYASLAPILKGREQKQPEARTIATQMQVAELHAFLGLEGVLLLVAALSSAVFSGDSLAVVPTVVGGGLIGIAQAFSLLITRRQLGVSTAYEQVGPYLRQLMCHGMKAVPPPAVNFALGIGAVGFFFPLSLGSETLISPLQALMGGWCLGFGARMAGGCTSGHGLSGLASLSFSSLIAVLAMFGGGMISRIIIDTVS